MKKLLLALLFGLCTTGAWAQRVQGPTNAGVVCQYNLSLPTLETGWFGYAQCDSNGKLITSGSGTTAATIADGADAGTGATTDTAATAGGTGSVNAKLRTITTQLNVKGYEFQLAPTVTVDAGAYATGDSVGGLITVTGAARSNGGTGILNGLRIKSNGGATNTYWVYAWSKTPSGTCTNNAAYSANIADNAFALVGFPTSVVMGGAPGAWDTATYAQLSSLIANFKNQDASPGTAIYLCLVTAGAVTPAATTDISIVAAGMQD